MFEGPAVVIAYLGGDRGVVVCAPLQERMSALTALEVPKEAAAQKRRSPLLTLALSVGVCPPQPNVTILYFSPRCRKRS
jgi:hypothetical protein